MNLPNQTHEPSPAETRLSRADRIPPGGRWSPRLYPWRYALLAGYILLLAGVYCIFSIEDLLRLSMPWQLLAGGSVVFYALQAAFLTGAPHWRWPRPTGRRPMWMSLVVGGLATTLLTLGLAGTLISLFHADRTVGNALDKFNQGIGAGPRDFPWAGTVFVAVVWTIWLLFFATVFASKPLSAFRRVYRLIVAGSVLELLITIPVDAQVRRRTTCYCGEGTFLGLIVGITLAAWAFGPGLVLLFLARRLERRRELQVCTGCGYDLRRLPGNRCPECGTAFQSFGALTHLDFSTMPRPRHKSNRPQPDPGPRDGSRRYHDRVARQYDAIYDDPYWHFHDELTWRLVKPHLPRDATAACADLGCGTGKWGLRLLKSGFATTFVDNAAAMIEQTRAKVEAMGTRASKATLLVADIIDLSALPPEAFSLVLAMGDPLSICSDAQAAVEQFRRITAPGGIVIATADNKLAALDHYVERGNLDALEQFVRTGVTHGSPPTSASASS